MEVVQLLVTGAGSQRIYAASVFLRRLKTASVVDRHVGGAVTLPLRGHRPADVTPWLSPWQTNPLCSLQ